MTEPVTYHTIGLGRGYNGFYCPESGLHLMGGVKPQANWPVAAPFTKDVKVGLRTGTLKDVRGTIAPEKYLTEKQMIQFGLKPQEAAAEKESTSDEPPTGEKVVTDPPVVDAEDEEEDDMILEDGERLTEEQIDTMGLKPLKKYITDNNISMDDLDLNSRSGIEEVRHALKVHFGYKMV